jgi:glycerol-3-phosphate acyltransferase PlsY
MLAVVLSVITGYLLGSIPFGLLLTRAAGLGDVRKIGSGNIGATNVLRTGNKKLAALTLLLDALKGTAAVLVGAWMAAWLSAQEPGGGAGSLSSSVGLVGGLSAFLGHVFPVWLGFRGGKGVATYIGVLIGFAWTAALVFAVAWLVTAVITRYSSLSALVATAVAFIYLAATGGSSVVPAAAAMSALLIWTHRENIRRLAAGTESKIGAKG